MTAGPAASAGPSPSDEQRAHAALLVGLPEMTPRRLTALLDGFDPPGAVRAIAAGVHPADRGHRFRLAVGRAIDPMTQLDAYRRAGVTVLLPDDPAYPARLAGDAGAPAVLFAVGDPGHLELRPAVAVVGTRSATPYGLQVASELAAGLIEEGVVVLSGLARGIDAAAHAGAVGALRRATAPAGSRGAPVAVVGTGLDVVYPQENAALWHEVASRGTVLSEAALGSPPRRGAFPARNRIIAALADVVVVVECHHDGGSWHTIEAAARRSIPVGAVPGSVKCAASAGTNQLLVDGCPPIRDVQDVMAAVELARAGLVGTSRHPVARRYRDSRPEDRAEGRPDDRTAPGESRGSDGGPDGEARPSGPRAPGDRRPTAAAPGPEFASPAQEVVWRTVGDEPTTFETVVLRTGLSVAAAARAGDELVAAGWLTLGAGWWSRRDPS